jgi:hypothetical protein
MNDVEVENMGTIVRFGLFSQDAIEFVDTWIDVPDWAWMGNIYFHVEPRYAYDIVGHMFEAGLSVGFSC